MNFYNKKINYVLALLSIVCFSLLTTGCLMKPGAKKEEQNNLNSTVKETSATVETEEVKLGSDLKTDIENSNLSDDIFSELNSETQSSLTSTGLGRTNSVQILEEEIDYNELKYEKHTNVIFDCNYVSDATQKEGDITILLTKIKGSISGLPGTYELIVPYSLGWKRGDKAAVSYEISYEDEYKAYVRDIIFIEKVVNEFTYKKQQEEAEEAERLKLEAELKAAEESAAEESKKAQEARQRQWQENNRIQESIRAAEEARRNSIQTELEALLAQ